MTEGLLQSPLRATDEAGVEQVDGLLHDEVFVLDEIEHNMEAQTITIPVRRQFHGGPERVLRSGLLFKTYEKDWMRSRITIRGVLRWSAEHDQGIGAYSFCSWRVSGGRLVIAANEALVVTVDVDRIDIEVEDIGFRGKSRISRGPMGVETSRLAVQE